MATMKAAVFDDFGGPDVVHMAEVERPAPGPGEALVQVKAAALNHLDLWVRRGLPVHAPMPHIGGADVAGVVAELGAGVAGAAVGDRVVVNPSLSCGHCEWCRKGEDSLCVDFRILGEHTQGGLAEYVVVPAANLFPIPDTLDFADAAAVPLVFSTAWRGLIDRARLRAGEDVLVTGGSGGVATAAVQIARLAGARVFAVTTGEHVEQVRALGAHTVYDRRQVDFSKEVWKDTGKRGVDVILDSVGQATWTQNVRALARGGRLVVFGATTGPEAVTDLRVLFWKQAEIMGTTMANHVEFETVMRLVVRGEVRPVVDTTMPLDQAARAHERLEAGQQFGKIVLLP